MKLSAVYAVTVVLLVFLTLQGWVLKNRIWSPNAINVEEAVLLGQTAEIRTPETVQVLDIVVQEGDRVDAGDVLFRVRGRGPFTLAASQAGVVTDIATTPGSFAQANETLARVVDTSADSLFIHARLGVEPEHVAKLKPGMMATVTADHLLDGRALDAVIASISPEYDSETRSVDVRLKFLDPPDDLSPVLTGLPVDIAFQKKTDGTSLWGRIASFFSSDSSTAQEE